MEFRERRSRAVAQRRIPLPPSGLGAGWQLQAVGDATGAFFLKDLSAQGIGCNYDENDCPDGVTGECISMITQMVSERSLRILGLLKATRTVRSAAALIQSKYLYIEDI